MKKQRFYLLGVLLMLCTVFVQAQEMRVTTLQRMDRDLLARTKERRDLNDVPCAVVRVSIANAKKYSFDGNVIGEVVYRPGEALVYMAEGSRNITIKSDEFGYLQYEFAQKQERQVVSFPVCLWTASSAFENSSVQ